MPTGNYYISYVTELPAPLTGMSNVHYYLGTSFTLNKQSRVYYNLTANDDVGHNFTGIGYIYRGQLIVTQLTVNS